MVYRNGFLFYCITVCQPVDWLSHSAHRLMLIDICVKSHEHSLLSGFQVIEQPWLVVTERQTEREKQTDGRPGKNNKPPNPKGGDMIKIWTTIERQPLSDKTIGIDSVRIHPVFFTRPPTGC